MSSNAKLDALRAMLPFYVNGTLGVEDKRAFEAALEEHSELREELKRETALQTRFVDELETIVSTKDEKPPEAQNDKVQSLFGSAKPGSDTSGGGLGKALSFLNPANWNPAVTFALAAAAVGQTAIIGSQSSTIADLEEENYQLASGQGDCDAKPAILVELAGAAEWSAVTALLDDLQVSIVGTGSFGVLQLAHDDDNADTAAVIEALSASALVLSAGKAS